MKRFGLRATPGICSSATLFGILSVCESRKVVQMRRFAYVQDLESVQMQRILCSDATADLFKCNAVIPGSRQP